MFYFNTKQKLVTYYSDFVRDIKVYLIQVVCIYSAPSI